MHAGPDIERPKLKSRYDVAIIGGGHNGLVAASYLARAGLSVVVLERNTALGGATQSKRVFAGIDARLSAYSYLVSLFPGKIVDDLGLDLELRSRRIASYTPTLQGGGVRELLLRSDADPRAALTALTGSTADYTGWCAIHAMQRRMAEVVWPSLLEPLVSRDTMRDRLGGDGQAAWQAMVEAPLGEMIEHHIQDDLLRGVLFTDAKIGISTCPADPALIQNRCFMYHVIGQGTGEWNVPVGGMGALVDTLTRAALGSGRVTIMTDACVDALDATPKGCSMRVRMHDHAQELDAQYVLCNASADVLRRLQSQAPAAPSVEGAGFKINLLLERLPRLRSTKVTPEAGFAGTFHVDEGYAQMQASFAQSVSGQLPDCLPGEVYCHTLTDSSILSSELQNAGYHTLTLFGLDLPYSLFVADNAAMRAEVLARYLAGINRYLAEPIEGCLAQDENGQPCIEAMSAMDLEQTLHLPRGNIFHGDLSWPFTDSADDIGLWGVETDHPRVLMCGSSAARGGAVSGIPGHNAAQCVLERLPTKGERP